MSHTPLCYICSGKLTKKGSAVAAGLFKPFLETHLHSHGGNVEKLVSGDVSATVNAVTMQYFHQFDLFAGEHKDDTLQVSWLMNPLQRFGIVFPRIPAEKTLFIIAHEECLEETEPLFKAAASEIMNIRKGVSVTLELATRKWFNKRGWLHACTDLYGERGAAELEHRSLL